MKILMVVHDFMPETIGGTEVYTHDISKELIKKHNIKLFFGKRKWDTNNKKKFEDGIYNGIPYTAVSVSESKIYYTSQNIKINQVFEKLIKDFKPDIIHFQHLLGLGFNLVNIGKKYNITMVMTNHDYFLVCPFAHLINIERKVCNNYNSIKCCMECMKFYIANYKIRTIEGNILRNIPIVTKNMIKIILNKIIFIKTIPFILIRKNKIQEISKNIELFLSPSILLKNTLVKIGIPEKKIVISELGINTEVFKDYKKNQSSKIRFGFIGSLVDSKGIYVLLEAFKDVYKAELHLYGPIIGKYKNKTNEMKNIFFYGSFNHSLINDILKNIDLLIVPSICMENFSLVIREALATKTPVIASNIGGLPEIIENGKNGYLFEVGNSKALKDKIEMIIKNPENIKKLKNNIKMPLSIQENAIELEKIYHNIKN